VFQKYRKQKPLWLVKDRILVKPMICVPREVA